MRKLIYILFLLPLLGSAQWETGLLVSKLQAIPDCTPDPNQWWTTAAPFSDPNCNESAALDGAWIIETAAITNITAESSGQYEGNYAYRFEYVPGSGTSGYITITLTGVTIGDTFIISVAMKSTQASATVGAIAWQGCTGWPASGDGYILPDGTWYVKTYNVTATTIQIGCRLYVSSSTSGLTGDNLWVDNFSAIKTN